MTKIMSRKELDKSIDLFISSKVVSQEVTQEDKALIRDIINGLMILKFKDDKKGYKPISVAIDKTLFSMSIREFISENIVKWLLDQ